MSQRHQPDKRAENSRRPPIGLEYRDENLAPGGVFHLAPNAQMFTSSVKPDAIYSINKVLSSYKLS